MLAFNTKGYNRKRYGRVHNIILIYLVRYNILNRRYYVMSYVNLVTNWFESCNAIHIHKNSNVKIF